MATTTTATTNFSSTVHNAIQARLIEELRATLVHVPLVGGGVVPASYVQDSNGTFVYTSYADLGAATTALTEGVAPTDQSLAIVTESFTGSEVGGVAAITNRAAFESPHKLILTGAERIARQAQDSMEVIARDVIHAGTNVIYSSTATSRATVAGNMTYAKLQLLYSRLQRANVAPLDDGLYGLILHPRQWHDIRVETQTTNYSLSEIVRHSAEGAQALIRNEAGVAGGFHLLISSYAKTFTTAGAAGVDVLSACAFGKEFLAAGDLSKLNAYYVPFGGDHSDPLAQKAQVGWRTFFGAKLIAGTAANGPRYLRLETAGTVLASGDV